jgi:DNA-binding SARP family transcriptional activator
MSSPFAAPARRALVELPHLPTEPLEVAVLGPLELRRHGSVVKDAPLRRQRVRELLCFLVANPRTTRGEITSALWPDLDDAAAFENLRVNLAHLVRVLEPGRSRREVPFLVHQDGNLLTLRVGDWLSVDVGAFERHLAVAAGAERERTPSLAFDSYERAIALYRGPYLHDAGDAPWALIERNRLTTRYTAAAVRCGELLIGLGRPEDAVDRAARALSADLWCEPAHRLLVRAHAATGDRLAAGRALRTYNELLAELGVRPANDDLIRLTR